MYQEFNQHKRSDTIKWIVAFSLIIVLMAGVIASILIAVRADKSDKNAAPVVELEDGSLVVKDSVATAYNMPAKLMFAASSAPRKAKPGHTVSIKLTATVTPIEAENKAVDWSVA